MPVLSVRVSDVEAARLRAAAAARGVTPSTLVREAVMHAACAVLRRLEAGGGPAVMRGAAEAAPPAPSSTDWWVRQGGDRRRRREAYTAGALEAWAAAIEEHGERRAAHWPERRGAADRDG